MTTYYFLIAMVIIVLVTFIAKYYSIKNKYLHVLLDLEQAYEKLGIDQFDLGYTDIGGEKAKYFSKNKEDREKMMEEYVDKLQNDRKRLGKKLINYSPTKKVWELE